MSMGQRIKVSRLAEGLSLRDLQAKIDNRVTAQAISKYERGESMPSSGVLIALGQRSRRFRRLSGQRQQNLS